MPTLEDVLKAPNLIGGLGELGIKRSNLMKQFVEDLADLAQEEVRILISSGQYDRIQAIETTQNGIDHMAETIKIRAQHMLYQREGVYEGQGL